MKTIALFLLLIIACACRKTNTRSGSGYWYFNGQKHLVNYTSRKDTAGLLLLTAMDSLPTPGHPIVNSIAILFGSAPTGDSMSYQSIAPYGSGRLTAPGPGQFLGFGTNTNPYEYIPDSCGGFSFLTTQWAGFPDSIPIPDWPWKPAPPAVVSVNNNKISITLPLIRTAALDRCGLDSPTVYGFIREQ